MSYTYILFLIGVPCSHLKKLGGMYKYLALLGIQWRDLPAGVFQNTSSFPSFFIFFIFGETISSKKLVCPVSINICPYPYKVLDVLTCTLKLTLGTAVDKVFYIRLHSHLRDSKVGRFPGRL